VTATSSQDVVDDGNEVSKALSGAGSSGQDVIRAGFGAVYRLLLVPVEPKGTTERMFNGFVAPKDFSAGGMETLLINQFIDGRTLDKGGVELHQRFRPEKAAIQTRGDELLDISVMNLQKSLYIGTVVPDEIIAVAEYVHEMSFADVPIVWH
jgi:hypothetical protein